MLTHNDRRYTSGTKDTYAPKFHIGEVVTVKNWGDERRTVTITGIKVTRRIDRQDSFYAFDDGTNAYEWSIEPTTYRRLPGDWADHLASSFNYLTGVTWSLAVHREVRLVEFTVTTPKGVGYVSAGLREDGDVECIGWHNVAIGDVAEGHDNLGSAIVALSNGLR